MSSLRLIIGLAVVMIGCPVSATRAAPADYVNFTRADSARLASATVERFLYRSGLEFPYTLIRHRDSEVKGFIVLLHGAGDNPGNFTKIAARLGLRGVQYVLPRAPFPMTIRLPDPLTGRDESFTGYGWLDRSGSPWVDRGGALAVFAVHTVIDELRPSPAVEPPLLIAGFRQAAAIAALWGAANPGRAQGLVLVGGYVEPSLRSAFGVPGLSLEDVPCLVLTSDDSPHTEAEGDLVPILRGLGASLEVFPLERGPELGDAEWGLIRDFVPRCAGFSPSLPPP